MGTKEKLIERFKSQPKEKQVGHVSFSQKGKARTLRISHIQEVS